MPDSIALCDPLMRGTFTKPAAQPTSTPPVGDGAGAIGDAFAALEGVADDGVGLEALEFAVWRQVRVLVVQVHDEADRHQVGAVVVEERAAAGAGVERAAQG